MNIKTMCDKGKSEMSEQHVTDSPKASPVVACSDLLAACVESEKDAWKELDRAIAAADYVAKCMDRARDEWAKAYAAVKTAEREQAANAEVRDPAT